MKHPDGAPTRPREKRYGWFRQYNDFPYHAKWRAVANRTKVELPRVIAIVTCLEVAANRGRPRGCVAEFSCEDCGAALGIPDVEVRKVYRCLQKRGWIDREYLTTWDERQPDREDPTAAERQARRRARIRKENSASHAVTQRDVTPRLDKTIKKEAEVRALTTGDLVSAKQLADYKTPKQIPIPFDPQLVKQVVSR